ncbi:MULTISPECIES: DUF4097 family beta strand repeat-containing protein [unclassified Breznakia]|uniref:DUF4097 family beta strand repeat-containing protein n=1 Tax=unclassified Breznakia TaxID=2623764 RepID=UPI00240555FB|nr:MULTISPECIES: DUF4097 family beta strand repeat-containing protein [unclassified Breznakia]MDF9838581.1 DUF4097 and DUF4098 domain-containing protein YvlB [Breznakia sp. PFB2-8]MDF9860606.1 DUF4097 and DUF4098 domain-containing protein YvlB [Breznakia sp. PH5-24]
MRNTRRVLIGILCGIILVLTGLLVYVIGFRGDFGFMDGNFKAELINTQSASIEGVKNISIDAYSSEVIFIQGKGEEIEIKEYASNAKKDTFVEVDKNGDELHIEVDESAFRSFMVFGSNQRYFEVYLPDSYKGELNIDSDSGDVTSRMNLELSNCKIDTSSGYIDVKNVKASNITFSTSSGDVDAKTLAGKIDINTSSGYISIENSIGDMNLDTSSGDVDLIKTEGNLDINTTSGYVSIDSGKGDKRIKTNSGDVDVNNSEGILDINTSSGYVEAIDIVGAAIITTSSGDIDVDFVEVTGDISLKATSGYIVCRCPENTAFSFKADTNSGDIETNFDNRLSYSKGGDSAEGAVGENAKYKITLETTSGDIDLSKY